MPESLQESLSSMKEMFLKRMANFEAELPKAQDTPSLGTLAAEYASFKTFITTAMCNLQQQIELLARSVDTMEMRSRRKMLLLHGVPEEQKEETAEVVVKVIQTHLESTVAVGDIRRCHRMGRPSTEHKPRPIVVKFISTAVRDRLWFEKTKFKNTGITISEFLTKERHQTFMSARQKYGISQCWTKEGFIHIVAPDGVRHRIVSLSELHRIGPQDIEKANPEVKTTVKAKRIASKKK